MLSSRVASLAPVALYTIQGQRADVLTSTRQGNVRRTDGVFIGLGPDLAF